MSTIHLVGGEKGGVGKSVVARLLAQLFIDRGISYAAIDADPVHGALARTYPDRTQAVDLAILESADQIMDRALASDRKVLVDLPAQSARPLQRWLEAGDILAYARDMNVTVVLWHVTDGGFDSVAELTRVAATFGGRLKLIVVRNWGRSADFSQLDGSATLESIRASGGQVVDIPALDSSTMYKVDQSSSSFWAASNVTDGPLSPMERRRAQQWLERCYRALDEVGDWN